MTARVALYLQDTTNLHKAIETVRYAESHGFEAVWQAEQSYSADALTILGAYAATTTLIALGSAVVSPWSRDPTALATTLITLDELATDRIKVGVGIGASDPAPVAGSRRDRPLLALRNLVTALREEVNHGSLVRAPRRIPVYLGATGLKTCTLAGEIADGVLLNYLVSPTYTARAMEAIARGAQVSGRSIDAIDRPQLILVSLDLDRSRAFDRIRPLVGQYLAAQPALMRACGIETDLLEEIAQVQESHKEITDRSARAEAIDQLAAIIPDSVLQQIAVVGTPSDVRAGIQQYVAAGCTCPVVASPGGDLKLLIDSLATR